MSAEFENEPIRGLPGYLPAGEHILWQGAPDRASFARAVMKFRWIAFYFGLMLAWKFITGLHDGAGLGTALADTAMLLPLVMLGLGLLQLFAWLVERTTVYTITNRRVVIRAGIAVPKAINIPFKIIEDVDKRSLKAGTGDLCLAIGGPNRMAYFHLWPHVRPWRLAKAEPTLRAIPKVDGVGEILAGALRATTEEAPLVRRVPDGKRAEIKARRRQERQTANSGGLQEAV
ncbi:MAG: photosynthetic complex putative assembly protein PuhB [Pseudomonadota bacterium]